jgi:hypothetical protein
MGIKEPKAVYTRSRLAFVAKEIEPLEDHEAFRVVTPQATFQMTKEEFYKDFQNVVQSPSYTTGTERANHKKGGYYHYFRVPEKAHKYVIEGEVQPKKKLPRLFARSVSEEERRALEAGLHSSKQLVRYRCRILLLSLEGAPAKQIALTVNYSYPTVRRIVKDFNNYGLASVWRH